MKIYPVLEAAKFLNRVREKPDTKQDQRQSDEKNDDRTPQEATEEEIQSAVDGFKADAAAQANGLTAGIEGSGPGLRIVLRDVSGNVLRQFTGQEFVRLRQVASSDGRERGKILDQKL